jgi:hypothetical protein
MQALDWIASSLALLAMTGGGIAVARVSPNDDVDSGCGDGSFST